MKKYRLRYSSISEYLTYVTYTQFLMLYLKYRVPETFIHVISLVTTCFVVKTLKILARFEKSLFEKSPSKIVGEGLPTQIWLTADTCN